MSKFAFVACLLIASLACSGIAAERTPQDIPPPKSDRAQTKDAKAAGSNKGKAANGSLSKTATSSWTTTLGGLIAVLSLIYLTAKVLRKSMPAAQRTLPAEVIQVLGRKPLDYRHSIHLIRCGSRLLVVASSQEGLTTLCEMTDPVEIDYLAGLCKPSEATSVADSFNQLFRRLQSSPTAAGDEEPDPRVPADPAALRLQERLQQANRQDAENGAGTQYHVDQSREPAA